MAGILPVISIFFRSKFKLLREDAVEVAFVFVANGYSYFLDGEGCIFEEECCLREAFFLQMIGIGFACAILNLVAEPEEIVMQKIRSISK